MLTPALGSWARRFILSQLIHLHSRGMAEIIVRYRVALVHVESHGWVSRMDLAKGTVLVC